MGIYGSLPATELSSQKSVVGRCYGPEGQPWGPRFTRGVCPAGGAPGAEHGSEQHGQDGVVSRAGQVPAGTVLGPQALSPTPGQLPRTRGSSTSHSTSWSLSLLIHELEQWCCDEDSVRSCTQRAADPTRVQALAGGIGWHSSAEGYSGAQAVSNITTARTKPAHDTDVASSIL